MSTGVIIVIQATSIILISAFFAIYQIRRRRALARELSSYREQQIQLIDSELEMRKNKIIIEQQAQITDFQNKITQNNEEIERKKDSIDKILQEYKNSRILGIAAELKNQEDEIKKSLAEANEAKQFELAKMQEEIDGAQYAIQQLRTQQTSILEALRRNAIVDEQYHLNLIESDLIEINELKTIANKYSRIRGVILKAVYDIYYAPEVRKLISRVVGDAKTMGIYRITSLKDGRIYVGKSVDIKSRWTTHFKRAAGIEIETQNMLYPEMRRLGLENFSFEILEVVYDDGILPDREKYWQEFYQAKTHGFSVK